MPAVLQQATESYKGFMAGKDGGKTTITLFMKQNTNKQKRRCEFSLITIDIDFHFCPLGSLLMVKLEIESYRIQGYQKISGDLLSWTRSTGRNESLLYLRAVECSRVMCLLISLVSHF